jgi:hypothetical protein
MKPKVFIGSSTERLDIAYAIQENLDHDGEMTVWTQGIFKLSKASLDSLVVALDKFDFAIFVFHPDDITQIRNTAFDTVRDNLIFELGLFIGRLGKDRVFFLIPRSIDKLHLPSDLLGVAPGTYDNSRDDGNLNASLGPFCNQVRKVMSEYVLENLEDIQNEPKHIKAVVTERKLGWEYLFAAELLEHKLLAIRANYEDIEAKSVIVTLKSFSGDEFFDWFKNSLDNFKNFAELFSECLKGLQKSFGPPGVAGKPIEIKNAVERIVLLCRELVNWEYELARINPPVELLEIKKEMLGWTKKIFIDDIVKIHTDTKAFIRQIRVEGQGERDLSLMLTMSTPQSLTWITQTFIEYKQRHQFDF